MFICVHLRLCLSKARSRLEKMMAKKTVIVTGASRGLEAFLIENAATYSHFPGIGFAAAEYLINHSHNVVLVARSAEALKMLQAKAPDRVSICVGDLADFSLGEKSVEIANKDFGRLDGLILNHGMLEPATRIADSDPNAWRQCFDVNFFSLVALVKAAVPSLRVSNGRVVFTSSGASTKAYSTWGAYGASKAAMNHLNLTLAAEEPSLTSISVRPGVVDTQMQIDIREVHSALMDEKDVTKFRNLHQQGQLVKPEQPGRVIAKLAVGAQKQLSGQFLEYVHFNFAAEFL
ncbi:MAG: hypothetical protein L6R40_000608 [Gallowayella cf. fulva]|nr:MAG: hypothetical protein L6R40_000608 [Xanthomendoza cf. fulva]